MIKYIHEFEEKYGITPDEAKEWNKCSVVRPPPIPSDISRPHYNWKPPSIPDVPDDFVVKELSDLKGNIFLNDYQEMKARVEIGGVERIFKITLYREGGGDKLFERELYAHSLMQYYRVKECIPEVY